MHDVASLLKTPFCAATTTSTSEPSTQVEEKSPTPTANDESPPQLPSATAAPKNDAVGGPDSLGAWIRTKREDDRRKVSRCALGEKEGCSDNGEQRISYICLLRGIIFVLAIPIHYNTIMLVATCSVKRGPWRSSACPPAWRFALACNGPNHRRHHSACAVCGATTPIADMLDSLALQTPFLVRAVLTPTECDRLVEQVMGR